ncbi:MAG: hypothetical protein EVA89_02355 [Sandaracinaceae bacterium]|nr:MAG: hypothetical protein EVA89_02355 [Sandaracinaceae bacterium]
MDRRRTPTKPALAMSASLRRARAISAMTRRHGLDLRCQTLLEAVVEGARGAALAARVGADATELAQHEGWFMQATRGLTVYAAAAEVLHVSARGAPSVRPAPPAQPRRPG